MKRRRHSGANKRPKASAHEEGVALKAPMLEVEYKAPTDDLAAIRARLGTMGARLIGEQIEDDVYYAHPLRSFAATDEALRVRTVTTAGGREQRVLTYKGPREAGPTRVREEVEVRIEGDMDRLLEALSFGAAGRVHKTRTLYRIDDLVVTADRVTGLSDHVEVEGIAPGPDGVAEVRRRVLTLVAALGLGAEEKRSYLEMVLERG